MFALFGLMSLAGMLVSTNDGFFALRGVMVPEDSTTMFARVYDAGATDDGRPYLVMPYVEGESLRHRLDRERQLPVDEALRIANEVAEALDYAHRRGVLHRDLKPSNVLVASSPDGALVKVIDFGIAKAIKRESSTVAVTTGAGQIVGTPLYRCRAPPPARLALPATGWAKECFSSRWKPHSAWSAAMAKAPTT